ncbi:MAG: YchJ family protein [Planctomycetota bacterium]|jgi:SEC-C motif-containing protein
MANCPCTSGKEYDACCEPYIKGEEFAPTAEALMRSRYSAYANAEIDYIGKTNDPKTSEQFDSATARKWSENSEWVGLDVLSTEDGAEDDDIGTVEFVAHYKDKESGNEINHHEIGTFRKEKKQWYFVDGRVVGLDPIVNEEPKVGRNDPCPCGSGKKHKKCCM